MQNSVLVPMVVEQTSRSERAFDIYCAAVEISFLGTPIDDNVAQPDHCPNAVSGS